MTRLTIEKVHRMSSRPWLFVIGQLEGVAVDAEVAASVREGSVLAGN